MAEEPNGGNAPGFEPAVTTDVQVNTEGSNGAGTQTPEAGAPNADDKGQQPAAQTNAGTPENGGQSPEGSQAPEKSETPSTEAGQFEEIIAGWKEDRALLQQSEKENQTLRDENAQLKNKLARLGEGGEEEDPYEGLSREERERKIIEAHEKSVTEKKERERQEVAREISFHERTDPVFRANKVAILKVADSFNASSIEQAIKIWQAQQNVATRAKKATEIETERKRNAGSAPGGQNGGAPAPTGYDPARDGKKSIREIYQEGGIR